MTIIPINDKYRIELDKLAWQVSKWHKLKNLERYPEGGTWKGESWHNSLESALRAVQRLELAESDLEGVQEVIKAIRRSECSLRFAVAASEYEDNWADEHRRIA